MRNHLIATTLAALLLGSCAPGGAPPAAGPNAGQLGEPFQLGVGQTAHIEPDLEITLVEITEDSRCPPDVVCVWEGQVGVLVELSEGGQPVGQIDLSTVRNPAGAVGVYDVELVSAVPPPAASGQALSDTDYVITLRVVKN